MSPRKQFVSPLPLFGCVLENKRGVLLCRGSLSLTSHSLTESCHSAPFVQNAQLRGQNVPEQVTSAGRTVRTIYLKLNSVSDSRAATLVCSGRRKGGNIINIYSLNQHVASPRKGPPSFLSNRFTFSVAPLRTLQVETLRCLQNAAADVTAAPFLSPHNSTCCIWTQSNTLQLK